jgi:hypothetical protein
MESARSAPVVKISHEARTLVRFMSGSSVTVRFLLGGFVKYAQKFGRSLAVMGAALALCATGAATPTYAAEVDPLQRQINEVLAKTEGGVQISRYEIAWDEGQAIMAFPLPGETHAPPSSETAQELQAKVSGLPRGTRETAPEMQPPANLEAAGAVGESVEADESESDVSVTAEDTCPTRVFGNDWYCFYQYKDYGGRRLQWSASYDYLHKIYFSKFNFENRTSSWSNKGGKKIRVLGRTEVANDHSCTDLLWIENDHERSRLAAPDNTADCFYTS